jgi:hypothetical protein
MTAAETTEQADLFLSSNGDWYEDVLLAKCAMDQAWFNEVKDLLCVEEIAAQSKGRFKKTAPVNDFSDYKNYAIYVGVRDYHNTMTAALQGVAYPPPTPDLIVRFLKTHATAGKLITAGELDLCRDKMVEVLKIDLSAVGPVVRTFFKHWLKRRRLIHASRELESEGAFGQKSNAALDNLQLTVSKIDTLSSDNSTVNEFHNWGSGLDAKEVQVERFSLGIDRLDYRLGGGPARGESALFIAASGVGKTVAACQFSMTLTLQGLRGLLITTEQLHGALELRMLSNYCRIPFNLIKNKFEEEALNHTQLTKARELRAKLENNLITKDWDTAGGSIVENLARTVDSFLRIYGSLDFIVLDWIGGGLGTIDTSRPEVLRLLYQNTADYMVTAAKDYNLMTFSFAQATPLKGKNRLRVDEECLSECKTMGRNMTSIVGITGFMNFGNTKKDDPESMDKDQYTDAQFFYVSKSRFGIPGPVKVLRNFGFQRFDSVI